MKISHITLAISLTAATAAMAQVEPAATGPGSPLPSGDFNYSARYSESAEFGSYLGDYQTASLSADATYRNASIRRPFNLTYGGGYNWDIAGAGYTTGLFQHLLVSQGFNWRKWNVTASDNVSYTPEAPTVGFSGVAGTGEPIGGNNPPTGQSILTLNTHVVNNTTTGEVEHQVGHATSLSAGGSYGLLRYPDGNGIDTTSDMANAGLKQRLNARNSLTADYEFTVFSYPAYNFNLMSNTGLFGLNRTWTHKISSVISAGPQWTESLDSKTPPSQVNVAVNASLLYQYRLQSANLNYTRGVNSGGGYLLGAQSDAVSGSFSQTFGKNLTIALTGAYTHTAGLSSSPLGPSVNENFNTDFGGVQATRRFGRYLTFFAGYTAINQATQTAVASNVLNGLQQIINFGIGYAPRDKHLRH